MHPFLLYTSVFSSLEDAYRWITFQRSLFASSGSLLSYQTHEHSIASHWVEDEVDKAIEEERQHDKQILFPIRLDNVIMETDESWAAKIRHQRHITDFTGWKDHDTYQKAFDRLLRDLKGKE